jgi:hypothetical protein
LAVVVAEEHQTAELLEQVVLVVEVMAVEDAHQVLLHNLLLEQPILAVAVVVLELVRL